MIDVVGWTSTSGESHLVTLLRSKILSQAVKVCYVHGLDDVNI